MKKIGFLQRRKFEVVYKYEEEERNFGAKGFRAAVKLLAVFFNSLPAIFFFYWRE